MSESAIIPAVVFNARTTLRSIRLRLGARLHRWALTRALADGADIASDGRLKMRGRALTRPSERRRVASGIEKVVEAVEDRHFRLSAAAPFDAAAVLEVRDELRALAADLRSDDAVSARGVALADVLVADIDSALYPPTDADRLRAATRAAIAALCARR
jgi:hypothetical protein